jgi:hypothetical protein
VARLSAVNAGNRLHRKSSSPTSSTWTLRTSQRRLNNEALKPFGEGECQSCYAFAPRGGLNSRCERCDSAWGEWCRHCLVAPSVSSEVVPDFLFSSADLRSALGGQAAKMHQAVEAEPEENLKQADPDEWARALAHHFAVACPELKRDEIWMEPVEDIGVDVSHEQMRAIFDPYSDAVRNYPGHRVVVHIPFEGEADVFKFTPSTRTYSSPLAELRGDELIKRIEYPHDRPANIDAEVDELLRQVDAWLAWAESDIDSFNASLVTEATRGIGVRRQRIEQRDAHLAQSSIPVRRPGESRKKTYIPDVLVRRPAPSLPQTRADDKPPQLEPVLEEHWPRTRSSARGRTPGEETELRATMHWPGDEERRADLNVFFVHTPQTKS